MKKIVLNVAPHATPLFRGIYLARGHINWLKRNGIVLPVAEHEIESVVYSVWANANRNNPLLINCLELFQKDVSEAQMTMQTLSKEREKAETEAMFWTRNVASNIIKKSGKGHLSVNIVRECMKAGKSFDEILNHFKQDYRHKSKSHPYAEFDKAKEWLEKAASATTNFESFMNTNGIIDVFDFNVFECVYEIKEYDDTKFTPKVVVESSSYARWDEVCEAYRETLHLIPIETTDITEDCLASFVEEKDVAGLLQYLRERNVTIL